MIVPKLRFPEFSEEWQEKKLSELTSGVMYGLNAAAKDFDGVNKYIRITDIDETSNNFVPNPLCSPEGDLDEKFLLKENDLVFARTGASTGKSYLYDNNDGKLYFAGFLIKFHINKANSKFVFYNTLRSQYENWVRIMSVRSGQPGINAEEYKKLELKLPSTLEQQKIASFLSKVDIKIEKLEKKQDLWETYKKGMMQQIFSQKLRFKDENGEAYPDWEEKKLGDILNVKYGKDYKHLDEGHIPVLGTGGVMNHVNEFLYDKPSVLIGRKGTINKPIFINEPFWTVDTLFYTEICGSHPKFTFYLASIINWLKYNEASGVPSLSADNIKKVPIKLPSSNEQTKIAEFLSLIDSKIEQLNKELGINKEFKKGLLQQMFC